MSFAVKSTHQYVNPQPELSQTPDNSVKKYGTAKSSKPKTSSKQNPTTTRPTTNSTNAATGYATRLTQTSVEDFY